MRCQVRAGQSYVVSVKSDSSTRVGHRDCVSQRRAVCREDDVVLRQMVAGSEVDGPPAQSPLRPVGMVLIAAESSARARHIGTRNSRRSGPSGSSG